MIDPHANQPDDLEVFLKDKGFYESSTSAAIKAVLSEQMTKAMKSNKMTKSGLAKKLKTSRSQIDRVLDPDNVAVSFDMILRVALATGSKLKIDFEQPA